MTEGVAIRPLTHADVAAYRALRLDALRLAPEAFSASIEEEMAMSDAEMAARAVPEAPGVTFGAFEAGRLAGMAGYVPQRRLKEMHKATMVGVHVAPRLRGTGIGRRLVEAVIGHAAARRVILQCVVAHDNHVARKLYRGLDFVSYGVERDALCVDGRFLDEELLALDLRGGGLSTPGASAGTRRLA